MQKEYSMLCMLILFSIFISTNQQACSGLATKADDCKDDLLTQTQKDDYDYVHCCYYEKEKLKNGATCRPLTSKQYKNIGKYIKYKEEDNRYDYKIKIDCQSSYLHIFLLALIIQLILL
jgi:hypothetical protein